MSKTRPLFFAISKNSRGGNSGKVEDTDSRNLQILVRIRVEFIACNDNTTQRNTMTDIPKTAVITIKIINFVDSKFDRFRK